MRAGIVVATSVLVLALAALGLIAIVVSSGDGTPWVELQVGDCLDIEATISRNDGSDISDVVTRPCGEPHDAEVVADGEANPNGDLPFPSDIVDRVDARCRDEVRELRMIEPVGLLPLAPDRRTWEDRSGRFLCLAVVAGGGTVSGSVVDRAA